MTELLLGVDLGTSDTKVLVLRSDGARIGTWRRPTIWRRLPGRRVETDARTLLDGVLGVITDALSTLDGPRVTALGLTGLAESGVVVDAAGTPRTPVIAWHDPRGAEQLARVPSDVRDAFGVTTGLPFHQQWTIAKLLWARDHGLELRPGHRWLNVPEYVAFALGADPVSEASLASRTGLLDLDTGRPWTAALDLLGVRPGFIPERRYAGEPAGTVRAPDAPPALRGATISVAGHDHPVAAFGAGAVGRDDLFNSCGTADTLLRAIPRVVTADERRRLTGARVEVGRHILPGTTLVNAPSRAGLVLRRVQAALGATDLGALDAAYPDADASKATVTGSDVEADDVVIALREGAAPADVWAAAVDANAGYTADLLARIAPVAGPYRRAVGAGGWLRLSSIRRSKSRVLPGLTFSTIDQPGGFGAAVLAAWAAAGRPGDLVEFSAGLRPTAALTP
ncbi:FGGY-family carbohydrate kinase [Cryptosporangium japonicum]|uniref:FGGY family carbohydrate kinase n=1 Tax=Cryptosporangium japonicum TaxID=80872 RepID=A0ABN0V625_9ACTN